MYYEGPIQALIFPVVSTHDVNQKLSLFIVNLRYISVNTTILWYIYLTSM